MSDFHAARLSAEQPVVPAPGVEAEMDVRGLCVFGISRTAVEQGTASQVPPFLEARGWEILHVEDLSAGGTATNGIHPELWIRGEPTCADSQIAMLVAALSLNPSPPSAHQRAKYPNLDNGRIMAMLQPRFSDLHAQRQAVDPRLAATANADDAVTYLQLLMPGPMDDLRARIVALRNAFRTPQPVLRDLSRRANRAKVELVEHEGQLAVRKTFRSSQSRFLEREVAGRSELRGIESIPELLGHGDNWILTPFYDDTLRFQRNPNRLLPLSVAKASVRTAQELYRAGYFLLDFQPSNILVDRHHGLKVIDLEFLHRYEAVPDSFEQDFTLNGLPAEFTGDLPLGKCRTYATHWQPYVGLSLHSLLNDPVPVQHLKRLRYRLKRLTERIRRKAARGVGTISLTSPRPIDPDSLG